ncbi:hypothetical protein [Flavobacterium sp.]|jgi:hypothetical protein|uniref:hypothetical protein n=1 Tax=Flavobacterium sp. TaxID=239 RepID=UPI0037BED870
MIKKFFLLFSILLFCDSLAQNAILKTQLLQTETLNDKVFKGFDGLGNQYFVKTNVFIKQSETEAWEYKNVALGKISSVDFINPLKIILFYEDFNTIILLDNQLNEIQKLNLFDIDNTIFASKIGMASQNQFWIYNALTQQIMLFDYLKNTSKNIGNPIQENIKFTQSDFNYFYWVDEINNWYSIDIFGKITLLANIPPFETMQIVDNQTLLFVKDNTLYCLSTKTQSVFEIQIVEKSFPNFYFKDQILAIFTDQQIKKYKIKLP